MAIARVQVKVGGAGKAADHDSYISREERYRNRLAKGEALEAVESGNMPAWAEADPRQFWRAADLNERANGTTYREHELALPRELDRDQRAALVREWVAQELGDRHAYRWAIHCPKAADKRDQPHAHLMFSERQRDGIERGPDTYFKRYNAKAPEKGGARKGHGPNAGKTLSAAERAAELRNLRGRWETLVNDHLERAGRSERIDMRSYADRGIDRLPEPKQLPSAWRDPAQRGALLEFRTAERDRDKTRAYVRNVIPDAGAALKSAERELKHQHRMTEALAEYDRNQAAEALAAALAQEQAAADRVAASAKAAADKEAAREARLAERMERFKADLAAIPRVGRPEAPAIEQPAPAEPTAAPAQLPGLGRRQDFGQVRPDHQEPAPKVPEQPKAKAPALDPERVYSDLLKPILERHQEAAAASIEALRVDRERWSQARDAHQADKPGKIRSPWSMGKWERAGEALEQERRDFYPRDLAIERATPHAIKEAARAELRTAEPGVVERADAQRQAREAKALAESIATAKREKAENELKRDKANVGKDFKDIANKREFSRIGYGDRSDLWKAMRPELKEKIEKYNALPQEQRPKELERIAKDPRTLEWLREQRELSKGQERGR